MSLWPPFLEDKQLQHDELSHIFLPSLISLNTFWDSLKQVTGSFNDRWLGLGDFNALLSSDEK